MDDAGENWWYYLILLGLCCLVVTGTFVGVLVLSDAWWEDLKDSISGGV